MQSAARPSGDYEIVKGPSSRPGWVRYCALRNGRPVLVTELVGEYDGDEAAEGIIGYLRTRESLLKRTVQTVLRRLK